MSERNVKILVVGGGKMGISHAALLSAYVGLSNVVICEKNLATRWILRFLGFNVVKDYNIQSHDIDAVFICTPTPFHFEIAKWAINSGYNVFVEKPLTLSSRKSSELVMYARSSKKHFQVGFVMRYLQTVKHLKAIIESQSYGKVTKYDARMIGNVINSTTSSASWLTDSSKGGGVLNEYGPHLLDLCIHLFGGIEIVESVSSSSVYSRNAEDRLKCRLKHSNEILGTIELDWADQSKRKSVISIRVDFEFGSILIDNSSLRVLDGEPKAIGLPQHMSVGFYLRGEDFSLQLESFLNAIESNDAPKNYRIDGVANFSDGARVDYLIEQIKLEL